MIELPLFFEASTDAQLIFIGLFFISFMLLVHALFGFMK